MSIATFRRHLVLSAAPCWIYNGAVMPEPRLNEEYVMETETNVFIGRLAEKAENLYNSKQYLCSEAILITVAKGFGLPYTEDQLVAMSAGFPMGIGDSGCACGALTGGTVALGIVLGRKNPHGMRKRIRELSAKLHDDFKTRHRSTCCRVLTKHVAKNPDEHFAQCMGITGFVAAAVTGMLIAEDPELKSMVDYGFLKKRDSRFFGFLKKAWRYVFR